MSNDIEPRKVEGTISITYWECNVLGHRHRHRKSAAYCIMRRKGESGELKKLKRNLSMIADLRKETPLVNIAKKHFCSDSNILQAVNSTLNKSWRFASENGGAPYEHRTWRRINFTNPDLVRELDYLVSILVEMEVKLIKLVE